LLDGGKDEVDQLVVQTQYGEEIHLTTDPGSPLFAFWNSLLMARKMAPEEERRRRESGLDA